MAELVDETKTLSFAKDPVAERCPVMVSDHDGRWPSFYQCARKPKETVIDRFGDHRSICGFHASVVRRANERHAKIEAKQNRSEEARAAAERRIDTLKSMGFDAEADYHMFDGGRYTGGVVLDAETVDRLIKRLEQWPRATRD